MASVIDTLILRSEGWRENSLRPILKILLRLGVSADQISFGRLILALPFPWLIVSAPTAAWWLIGISIAADALDGTLARFAKAASDRGKFIDVLTDQLTFILLGFGLIRLLPGLSLQLGILTVLIPLAYLMRMVEHNEGRPSDWILRPEARLTAYKIAFLLIIIALLSGLISTSAASVLLAIETAVVSLHFMFHYLKFINARR